MNNKIYKAIDICQVIINYYQRNYKEITNLGLQKVLFFIQWHFLKKYNRECFVDEIQAWKYGPVVPNVYSRCCEFGLFPIVSTIGCDDNISPEDKQIIEQEILPHLINLEVWQLVEATHKKNGAWDQTNQYYQKISLDDIKNDTTIKLPIDNNYN